jgi:hypothetical protein
MVQSSRWANGFDTTPGLEAIVLCQREGVSVVRQLAIKWTVDPTPTTLEHVRVDHRCGDILVSQEFLHGADIGPFLQPVRGKAKMVTSILARTIAAGPAAGNALVETPLHLVVRQLFECC